MKIATITYHRALNYGSVLQTYALNKYLRLLGNDVETIDFSTDVQSLMYKKYSPVKFNRGGLLSVARNIYYFAHSGQFDRKIKKFDTFIKDFIPLSKFQAKDSKALKAAVNSNPYDLYFCGSDQIWNTNCGDFSTAYLLDFVDDKTRCCAYAPSIGVTKVDAASEELFRRYLTDYKKISVREKGSADYLENIINRKVDTVLDPVFLLEKEQWLELTAPIDVTGKFVLGYFIGDVAGMRKYSQALAKHIGGKVVVINQNLRDVFVGGKCIRYDAGPREFLWLINNATMICTNSFHAVAFSLIFNKNFWVFVDSNAKGEDKPQQRIYNIIRLVGQESRIINIQNCDSVDKDAQINWSNVDFELHAAVSKSKSYIRDCLQ